MSALVPVLEQPVLQLNRNWTPIRVIPVADAMAMLFEGVCQAVRAEDYSLYNYEQWSELRPEAGEQSIKTAHLYLKVPEVVVLCKFDKIPDRKLAFTRANIHRRDAYTCQYCGDRPGTKELSIDHVVPRSKGGQSTWENCVLACTPCNRRKADKTLSESGLKLARQPKKPLWSPRLVTARVKNTPANWAKFVDEAYWNSELQVPWKGPPSLNEITWLFMLLAVGGAILNNLRYRSCFYCWSLANVGWSVVNVQRQLYPELLTYLFFLALNVHGWINWSKPTQQSISHLGRSRRILPMLRVKNITPNSTIQINDVCTRKKFRATRGFCLTLVFGNEVNLDDTEEVRASWSRGELRRLHNIGKIRVTDLSTSNPPPPPPDDEGEEPEEIPTPEDCFEQYEEQLTNLENVLEAAQAEISNLRNQISARQLQLASGTLSQNEVDLLNQEISALNAEVSSIETSTVNPISTQRAGVSNQFYECARANFTTGPTSERPEYPPTGYMYFDITLLQPVWFAGNGKGWVDATGASI